MDTTARLRADALAIYREAVAAVDPGPAVRRALSSLSVEGPMWLIAVGKAAPAMANAAAQCVSIRGGLVVAADASGPTVAKLSYVVGDHPQPGPGSRSAAESLAALVRSIGRTDRVLVLLSGGTSSLIGAPASGLTEADYLAVVTAASRAGLPIRELNLVRKRVSRWGGGRLATALTGLRIDLLAVSDILDDDLAALGSGPCTADPTPLAEARPLINGLGLDPAVCGRLETWFATADARLPDPGHAAFAGVHPMVIASNRSLVEGAIAAARRLGYQVEGLAAPVVGEATRQGRRFAARLVGFTSGTALVAGGETTVPLGSTSGLGGRCQEFALAGAEALASFQRPAALLAAGSDGRDGPTDAAGALVDTGTWAALREANLDPHDALARHDAYPALDRCGALVRTGGTGTNVADLLIGLTG